MFNIQRTVVILSTSEVMKQLQKMDAIFLHKKIYNSKKNSKIWWKLAKKQRKMRNWRFNMVAAFAKNWKKYNHCLITLNQCNLNDEFIHKRTTSQIHQINNKMNQKIQQKNWTKLSLYSVSGVYKVCITNKLKTEAKKMA